MHIARAKLKFILQKLCGIETRIHFYLRMRQFTTKSARPPCITPTFVTVFFILTLQSFTSLIHTGNALNPTKLRDIH